MLAYALVAEYFLLKINVLFGMLNAKMLTTVNPQCWHKKFKKKIIIQQEGINTTAKIIRLCVCVHIV